jgi:hypothetical protein
LVGEDEGEPWRRPRRAGGCPRGPPPAAAPRRRPARRAGRACRCTCAPGAPQAVSPTPGEPWGPVGIIARGAVGIERPSRVISGCPESEGPGVLTRRRAPARRRAGPPRPRRRLASSPRRSAGGGARGRQTPRPPAPPGYLEQFSSIYSSLVQFRTVRWWSELL